MKYEIEGVKGLWSFEGHLSGHVHVLFTETSKQTITCEYCRVLVQIHYLSIGRPSYLAMALQEA